MRFWLSAAEAPYSVLTEALEQPSDYTAARVGNVEELIRGITHSGRSRKFESHG
jgi:hypothetical protein